ncbi:MULTISPECIES: hypothetical protein [Cyanophyceae]|uniref:hypothetical protein n=1 Tax=Cyanophyceae TaxID=3028117 RepID=UPI001688D574|nr:hypothetical protein [Trichocoleus sp. FACHB-69]MBD1930713.1 hypothetical protein [Trichocoleus sp. FACHB-69]
MEVTYIYALRTFLCQQYKPDSERAEQTFNLKSPEALRSRQKHRQSQSQIQNRLTYASYFYSIQPSIQPRQSATQCSG